MPSWLFWMLVVLIVGVGVITVGALRDRHVNRERAHELTQPPDRALPGEAAALVPHYLSDHDASRPPQGAADRSLDEAGRRRLDVRLRDAVELAAGMAAAGFVTDPSSHRAVLTDARVLVCGEPVESLRSLLGFLERSARDGRACVVLAPRLDPTVLRTLEVNTIQRRLDVVVVLADDVVRGAACAATGARPVETTDLQAGWLPAEALGSCALWVSGRRRSWVLATPAPRSEEAET